MMQQQNGIRIEVQGQFRQYSTKYRLEDKLASLAKKLDREVFESIKYTRYTHEPASYNDWKKTRVEHIEFIMAEPEIKSYADEDRKVGISHSHQYHYNEILKEFPGFKFAGVDLFIWDKPGSPKQVTVKFQKEAKI